MPGRQHPRDTIPIFPVVILILILWCIVLALSELAPDTTFSTALLAQASQPVDYESLDKQCLPSYSYDCDSPLYDTQTGQKCGRSMPVETSQVKGLCQHANFAHATQYKNADGGWDAVEYGKPQALTEQVLPSYQTSNLSTFGAPSSGQLDNTQSLLSPDPTTQPGGYGQSFDSMPLPQVPTLGQFPGPVFNETTGQWEGPGTQQTGEAFNGLTDQLDQGAVASPLLQGQVAPPPSGTTFDDQGTVVSVPQTSEAYQLPTQEYQSPPSEDNVFNGTPNTLIPPEYEPQPGETFTVGANGQLSQTGNPEISVPPQPNNTQDIYLYAAPSTFNSPSNGYEDSYQDTQPSSNDQSTVSPSNGGFLSSTMNSIGNYFSNLFSKF
jgi:hypothetical protein